MMASWFLQLQDNFRHAVRNRAGCKTQPCEDVEHTYILGENIRPDILKTSFAGYPDEYLHKFRPEAFALKPVLYKNGQFAGRQVLIHDKSRNPYHAFLSFFLHLCNYCHMPIIVNITEKNKPLMGYVFKNREEPGPQCAFR